MLLTEMQGFVNIAEFVDGFDEPGVSGQIVEYRRDNCNKWNSN